MKPSPIIPGVEGVEFVPELKKVYTSDAGDNTIGVIDLQMTVIKKLPTEAKPDCKAYAALSTNFTFRMKAKVAERSVPVSGRSP
jgi:DNA-binding beta-propeller fold protein YncE